MTAARQIHYSYAEYLASLEVSTLKLEWCRGVIYAMAGGTPAHAQLAASLIGVMHRQLPDGCRLATLDMKVRIDIDDLTTFPDVSIVCGAAVLSTIDPQAVVNPILLVEVTSRSTEDYDRGDKLEAYKNIESLRTILIVSHRERRITVIERTATAWSTRDATSGATVRVDAPGLSLAVDDVFAGIALDGA